MNAIANYKEVIPEISKIIPLQKLFRSDIEEDRYYIDDRKRRYMSVTTAAKYMLPSLSLNSYYKDNDSEYIDKVLYETSSYGTTMHVAFTEILKNGRGNFESIMEFAKEESISYKLPHLAHYWASRLQKDVAAFLTFLKERKVNVICAEMPVASYQYNIGGCIDLICEMEFNGKIVNAIVDYKSGKNSYKSHELQLHIYKSIFEEVYSDILRIDYLFNFFPNDFRLLSKPTYKLKNQTNSVFEKTAKERMKILNEEGIILLDKVDYIYIGDFDLESDLSKNIKKVE